jgi:hypothetical protein
MNQCIGYNSIIRTNGVTITYAYNQIDASGNITKPNVQESFVLQPTDTDLNSANNVILNAINLRLNPPMAPVAGTITVKYVDVNGNNLETPMILNNLPMATYYYTANTYAGYNLSGSNVKSVILDPTNLNQTVTFAYVSIITGTITIENQDENKQVIGTPIVNKDLSLGSYTYNNQIIDGYTLIGDTSQTVILTVNNTNVTIIFNYKKIVTA